MLPMVHLTLPAPFTSEYFPDLMVLAAASLSWGLPMISPKMTFRKSGQLQNLCSFPHMKAGETLVTSGGGGGNGGSGGGGGDGILGGGDGGGDGGLGFGGGGGGGGGLGFGGGGGLGFGGGCGDGGGGDGRGGGASGGGGDGCGGGASGGGGVGRVSGTEPLSTHQHALFAVGAGSPAAQSSLHWNLAAPLVTR